MWDGTFASPAEREKRAKLEQTIAALRRRIAEIDAELKAATEAARVAFEAAEAEADRLHTVREWRELPRNHPDWKVVERANALRAAWLNARHAPSDERAALQERLHRLQGRLDAGYLSEE